MSYNSIEFKNHLIQHLSFITRYSNSLQAYNPNDNGSIERLHSSLLENLRILQEQNPNNPISHLINYTILSYNNSIQTSTDYIHFQILSRLLDYKNHFDENERLTQ